MQPEITNDISVPMIRRGIVWLAVFWIGAIVFSGCGKSTEIPDVSDIDGSFPFVRFEEELFSIDPVKPGSSLSDLRESYPAMWDLYFGVILPIRDESSDTVAFDTVLDMLRSERMRWLYDTVQQIYPDMGAILTDLEEAFRYYRHYFPERRTPRIYTLISDFSYFPFIFPDYDGRDGVGISLEMFLGSDFPYRSVAGSHPVFSGYLLRTYNRDHLVKKTLDVIIDDLIGPPEGNRMLDIMIRNGKQLYLLEQFMPFEEDTVIMEYTPDKLQWCRDNERNLWAHFLTEDLLYSQDFSKFQKLVQHSPNAPGLPLEAPGRTANWMGYRIVKALMERQGNMSLLELVEMRDAQKVLDLSKYKPG